MATKFKNKALTVGGETFDSNFEYNVYLSLLNDYAIIYRQIPFYLMPPIVVGYHQDGEKPRKKVISQRKYIMDFVGVTANGLYVAIEAKGIATDVWTLKRDMLIWQYIVDRKTFQMPSGAQVTLDEYQVIYQDKAQETFRRELPTKKRLL